MDNILPALKSNPCPYAIQANGIAITELLKA
jgi:hypothetical protein